MLNMALLLRIVNEGEHVVVNQVLEEVNPPIEVGLDNCVATLEPDFFRQRRQALDAYNPTLCFYKLISLLLLLTALSD